jgi:hypothetical protein
LHSNLLKYSYDSPNGTGIICFIVEIHIKVNTAIMGMGSKIVSVVLRFVEFSSAIIVTSILGRYLHFLDAANVGAGSRIVYATVIGGLSIFFSLILILPFKYSFYAFPLDFALFICWMVAFGLLANVSLLTYPYNLKPTEANPE